MGWVSETMYGAAKWEKEHTRLLSLLGEYSPTDLKAALEFLKRRKPHEPKSRVICRITNPCMLVKE